MPKQLSELTLILHRMDMDGNFVYQRRDTTEEIKSKNIEFLSEYPNPILVSLKCSEFIPELINLKNCIPQRANALVIGHGKKEGKKAYIYPAVYCHVEGLAENQ